MSALRLQQHDGRAVTLHHGDDALLCRYVYASAVPANESPRPYFHPLNSLAGDTLTNFRPNDHPWHHALSLTLNSVDGWNFWGGPSRRPADGYQWRADHGMQQHVAWRQLACSPTTATIAHTLEWRSPGETLLHEERTLDFTLDAPAGAWTLRWRSTLANATTRALTLGNPHSLGGLPGSHYTGLQFRGARELLDDHLDPTIGISAEGDLEGEKAVHGASARWMEWRGQLDGTLHRVKLHFENAAGPLPWFVRRGYPLAAFSFHAEANYTLPVGASLALDHTLTFSTPTVL